MPRAKRHPAIKTKKVTFIDHLAPPRVDARARLVFDTSAVNRYLEKEMQEKQAKENARYELKKLTEGDK